MTCHRDIYQKGYEFEGSSPEMGFEFTLGVSSALSLYKGNGSIGLCDQGGIGRIGESVCFKPVRTSAYLNFYRNRESQSGLHLILHHLAHLADFGVWYLEDQLIVYL